MMAEKYTSELLGVVIAQIAQTIGYSRTQSAPLELLEDILLRFIQELARDLHRQAEHANRVEPNLKDVLLSLKNVSINVLELLDYIGNVEPIPFVRDIPAYPVKRISNMNFLKPGSVETLTRPVHIFEYLPPMLPTESTPTVSSSHSGSSIRWPDKLEHENIQLCKLELNREPTTIKLVQDVKTDFAAGGISKLCTLNASSADNLDHDGHALREISSVVMTTGGFISPAIEGKLPEAYIPDIIEKFKGLDAPSVPHVPKLLEIQKDASNDIVDPIIKIMDTVETNPNTTPIEQKPFLCNNPTTSNEMNKGKEEENASVMAVAVATPTPNTKTKKNKKKIIIAGQMTNDSNAIKAMDKARRKALKMCQKLSKNQIDGGGGGVGIGSGSNVTELKKTKMLNRGILSDLPDGSTERMQLEKLIKKQTKQRQKQLKSQKQQQQQQQRQFQSASKFSMGSINTMPLNPFSSTNSETLENPINEVAFIPPAGLLLDNKDTFNIPPTPNMAIELIDEIKLANEPDRNKLNIFKKISKQKANKLNIASNLYENANNTASPLINLPSGTTITPAPPAPNANENITNTNLNMSLGNLATYDYLDAYSQLPPATTNLMPNDLNKPKKRGRKPGGKNQCRPQAPSSTSISPIQMHKKTKASKLNTVCTYPDGSTLMPTLPTAGSFELPLIEPLNLSQVDQLKSNPNVNFSDNLGENKFQKPKEKKDRKKSKAKYNHDSNVCDNGRELNKKICLMDTEMQMSKTSTLLMGAESDKKLSGNLGFVTNNGPRPATNFTSSSNEGNILPMLPLLHFPPRPGLIPTGPGLFPPSLTSFNNTVACGPGSNLLMPHSFMNFSATATDNKATLLSGLLPLSDIHMERSYCNVAPLVPDSMKLPTTPVEGIKLKSPHRLLSSECTDKDLAHRSTIMPMVVQGGNDESAKATKVPIKSVPTATGNVGDPIEVSDSDSNDDGTKANDSLSPRHKSNLMHPSNLINPIIESCQVYANPLPPQYNRQAQMGALKLPQADLLSVAPPPSTTARQQQQAQRQHHLILILWAAINLALLGAPI
uniref:Architectural regulator of copia enhancer n=1 Tax=Drosophila hydei TaxID=7224 RepID=Q9NAZ5_DROHY|nr:architectural regulator of copia enhancer [Drosophila hydei]